MIRILKGGLMSDNPEDSQNPLYLALLGHPSMPGSAQKRFHLFLPEKQADLIDSKVAGSRNTAFILLLFAGLDLLKRRAGKKGTLFVNAEKEIRESGYVLDEKLAGDLLDDLKSPLPKEPSITCLSLENRMPTLPRKVFTLILPAKLAKEIDERSDGSRNSVFVVLLSIGLEVYRRRSTQEKYGQVIHVRDFFEKEGYGGTK